MTPEPSGPNVAPSVGKPLKWVTRDACPVCGEKHVREVRRSSFSDPAIWPFLQKYYRGRLTLPMLADGEYVVAHCPSCGLFYQVQILDDDGLIELYERLISTEESLDKRLLASHGYYSVIHGSIEVLQRLFAHRRPKDVRVLDFGMGWGHWAAMARAFGFDVYGAELSVPRVEYARQHFAVPVVDDVLSGKHGLTFDFINTDQVIEHVARPAEIVGGLSSILAPGGVLKIFVPTGVFVQRKIHRPDWRAAKDALHPLEHINSFTPLSTTQLAEAAGLRRLHFTDFPRWPDRLRMMPGWLKARITPSWYFRKAS